MSASSPALTVTIRSVAQFDVVNTTLAGVTVTSVSACPLTVTVTSAVGCEVSTTV